jgi:hypothetical protein
MELPPRRWRFSKRRLRELERELEALAEAAEPLWQKADRRKLSKEGHAVLGELIARAEAVEMEWRRCHLALNRREHGSILSPPRPIP